MNKFISVPKDKGLFVLSLPGRSILINLLITYSGTLNCASYVAGIIEAVLNGCNFVSFIFLLFPLTHQDPFFQPAKVTAHWHKGTTFMIKFDESVIARDKIVEGR